MKEIKELIEVVERIAANRPRYSLPNFLPRPVLVLGVLTMLKDRDYTGDVLIRELASLSRRASGYGVNYPLLHDLEAAGILQVYRPDNSPRRVYTITEQGRTKLARLNQEYSAAQPEQFQTGFTITYGLPNLTGQSDLAYAS